MNLQQRLSRGLALVFLAASASRLVSFAADLGLMRLLEVEDFGALALGLMVVNALGLVQSLGVGEALVVRTQSDPESCDTGLVLAVAMGAALCGLAWVAAPWIALLAGGGDRALITQVLRWLSLAVALQALAGVPNALLDRDLAFHKKFYIDTLPVLVYAGLSLGLAWKGSGVWSLVWGRLGAAATACVAAWALASYRPRWQFSWARARELVGYGRYVAGAGVVSFLVVNIDDAIVVWLAGMEALGYYNRAYLLANLPATAIAHLANRVAFPAYARLRDQPSGPGPLCGRLLQAVGLLSLPLGLGLGLLAGPFVLGVLGAQWRPVILLLPWLALYGLLRALLSNTGPLFNALGFPQAILKVNLLQLGVLLVALYPLVDRWGGLGASLGVLAGTLLSAPLALRYLGRLAGPRRWRAALWPLWLPGGAMAATILAARWILEGAGPLVQLLAAGGAGALVYGGALWFFQRRVLSEALRLIKGQTDA